MRVYPSDRIGGGRKTRRRVRRNKKPGGFFSRLRRWFVFTTMGLVLLSSAAVITLRWVNPPTTAFMLQDTSDKRPLQFQWVTWQNIGSESPLAVVASEDQKFAQHFGFDLASIQDSIDSRATGASLRGASTITQQVAKNLFLWSGRNFLRKGMEAYFTVLIELAWSKQRILEVYLNVAEFGPGIYGVRAASETYFAKSPNTLTDAEAALLASVLPNPKRLRVDAPSEYVRQRQHWIIKQMRRLRAEQWLAAIG